MRLRTQSSGSLLRNFYGCGEKLSTLAHSTFHVPVLRWMFYCVQVCLASQQSPGCYRPSSKTDSFPETRPLPQPSSRQGWGSLWSRQGSWPGAFKFPNWALTLPPAHRGFQTNVSLLPRRTEKDSWVQAFAREDNSDMFTTPLFWKTQWDHLI